MTKPRGKPPKRDKRHARKDLQKWKFLEAYLGEARGNAIKAAKVISPTASYTRLCTIGSEMLADPDVSSVIQNQARLLGMTPQMLLSDLSEMYRARVSDMLARTEDGKLALDAKGRPYLDLEQARKSGVLAYIEEITINDDGSIKVKMPKRMEIASLMAKVLGMVSDRVQVEHSISKESQDAIRAEILAKLDSVSRTLDERDRAILAGLPAPAIDVEPE